MLFSDVPGMLSRRKQQGLLHHMTHYDPSDWKIWYILRMLCWIEYLQPSAVNLSICRLTSVSASNSITGFSYPIARPDVVDWFGRSHCWFMPHMPPNVSGGWLAILDVTSWHRWENFFFSSLTLKVFRAIKPWWNEDCQDLQFLPWRRKVPHLLLLERLKPHPYLWRMKDKERYEVRNLLNDFQSSDACRVAQIWDQPS